MTSKLKATTAFNEEPKKETLAWKTERLIKGGSGGPKLKKKFEKNGGSMGGVQGGGPGGGSRGGGPGGGGHGRSNFFEKISFRKKTAERVAGVLARIFHPPTRG